MLPSEERKDSHLQHIKVMVFCSIFGLKRGIDFDHFPRGRGELPYKSDRGVCQMF